MTQKLVKNYFPLNGFSHFKNDPGHSIKTINYLNICSNLGPITTDSFASRPRKSLKFQELEKMAEEWQNLRRS